MLPSVVLRALLVSYQFPPVGGAGVARVAKLAKYLPAHGVTPSVLTVANPSVPVMDESRVRDLPAGLPIHRARTLEPGYGVKQEAWAGGGSSLRRAAVSVAKSALIPDPQVLWQPAAQARLARLLASRERPDVVCISGPPFSQFLLAPLARLGGAGVVLDYRDEWSTYRSTYEMMGRLGALVGDPLEAALLRTASAVTTATESFRQALLGRFSWLDPARVHAIPNGYDPEDFPGDLPAPPRDRYVITYAGTIFKLTSARGFLGAIRRLHRDEPALARRLEVRFLGRIVETEADAFEGMEALGVTRTGYVPHDQVIPALARSHLALCLLDEVPGVERIFPAKIFELMYLGRPCLVLAPPGELTQLTLRHRLGTVLAPRDEASIAAFLAEELRRGAPLPIEPHGIGRYDRKALAGEFAAVLRRAGAGEA